MKNGECPGNEYLLPSDLSYITIEGFKDAVQAYGKVERHYHEQLIDLLRTFGVRIIDKVAPEFSDIKESKGLKDRLSRNIAYIALIKSHHTRSDYDECVKEIKKQIDGCTFYQCQKIELSYGDNGDKISKATYADVERGRFYCVGELGPSKMELLMVPLCKYLGLKDKDRELFVVLISNAYTELDEYFKDKGYAEDLLNNVKQVVASQNKPTRIGNPDSRPTGPGEPESDERDELAENDATEVSPDSESGVVQTAGSDDSVLPTDPEKRLYKIGEYEVCKDEYIQLSKLFADGLTGEEEADQKRKWQDESKLACFRLFNYLEGQGLEPSMDKHRDAAYIVMALYADIEDEKRPDGHRGPNIDINNGKRIHVISARAGVAYITPHWWNKVKQIGNNQFEICAITGARTEEFVFIRNRDDLLSLISDNALPVKIRGVNADERMALVSDLFDHVDSETTAAKIYALLKVKSNTNMNKAFEKGFCSDEMAEREVSYNSDL